MKTIRTMVVKDFFPIFMGAMSFFVLLVQILDLFSNLWRYLNQDVPFFKIMYVAWLFLPKCISYALPVSVLFAVSFILGNYYARNELIAVFGSGISLLQTVFPLMLIGLSLSLAGFAFDNYVVIPTYRHKKELVRELLGQVFSYNNSLVTIMSDGGRIVYYCSFYNDKAKTLSDVTVVERTDTGGFFRRVEADTARYDEEEKIWIFDNCRVFTEDGNGRIIMEKQNGYRNESYNELPETFRNIIKDVKELKIKPARDWIKALKRSGLPYREALTDFHQRFSFSLTPFIVALISCAMGGKFKKNILLMSLLFSLGLASFYYILQMISVLLAKLGSITPLMGAWSGFIVFLLLGLILFKKART